MIKNGWVTGSFGGKYHYVNGELHNDNGPAVVFVNSEKFWYKNGKKHREDGPAIENYYGKGNKEWWYENKSIGVSWNGYTQEKFEQWLRLKVFE